MEETQHAPPLQKGRRSALGSPRKHLRETTSTNDEARALAEAGAPHGALVTADFQTAGRGRRGRSWEAQPGEALLMSLVLRELPDDFLTLRIAAAVAAAIGDDARVKWPNDVLIDGRKVAGVLCETRAGEPWAVAGIGINVASAPPIEGAGEIGARDREQLLADVLEQVQLLLSYEPPSFVAAWDRRDMLRDKRVEWAGGSGIAAGIDAYGHLIVDLDDGGRTELDSGEVSLARYD